MDRVCMAFKILKFRPVYVWIEIEGFSHNNTFHYINQQLLKFTLELNYKFQRFSQSLLADIKAFISFLMVSTLKICRQSSGQV